MGIKRNKKGWVSLMRIGPFVVNRKTGSMWFEFPSLLEETWEEAMLRHKRKERFLKRMRLKR